MSIERFEIGPRFSEMTVVSVGNTKLIYISGQVAENDSLDITGQTRQVLNIIERLLARVGAGREHIAAVRIYLASVGDYAAMNSVWDDWVMPGQTPARTTVAAKLMNAAYKVEIEVYAAVSHEPISEPHDCGPSLQAQDVELDAPWSDEAQLRQSLTRKLARSSGLSEQDVRESLLEREALGSTSLGHGVALPHARVDHLAHPVAAFVRLAQPMALQAPDDKPVDLVLALLIPREQPQIHLKLFAQIAEILSDPLMRSRLRQAKNAQTVIEILTLADIQA